MIADDLKYMLTHLWPRTTGLPMTIWVSPQIDDICDPQIRIAVVHGDRTNAEGAALISINPSTDVIDGYLSTDDERIVLDWINLNEGVIRDYWLGNIDSLEMCHAVKGLTA
jgi:hypothetical protein